MPNSIGYQRTDTGYNVFCAIGNQCHQVGFVRRVNKFWAAYRGTTFLGAHSTREQAAKELAESWEQMNVHEVRV